MPVLMERLWTIVGRSNTPIVCGLYRREDERIELICHWASSADALIRSKLVADVVRGKSLANEWLAATKDKGFTEVKGGH
jgi:hypothetical protein